MPAEFTMWKPFSQLLVVLALVVAVEDACGGSGKSPGSLPDAGPPGAGGGPSAGDDLAADSKYAVDADRDEGPVDAPSPLPDGAGGSTRPEVETVDTSTTGGKGGAASGGGAGGGGFGGGGFGGGTGEILDASGGIDTTSGTIDGGGRGTGGQPGMGGSRGTGGVAGAAGLGGTSGGSTGTTVDCGGGVTCSAPASVTPRCVSGRCMIGIGGGEGVYQVAFDATKAYWADSGDPYSDGSIKAAPKGGGKSTTLASHQYAAHGIAVDDNNVYWLVDHADDDGGSVMSMPKTGGTPVTLATVSAAPSRIAINETSVFWTTCPEYTVGDLMTVAKTGGTVTSLDTKNCFTGLVADANRVYYGNYTTYTVWSVPVTGGTPSLIGPNQFRPGAMTQDDAYVYWVNYGPGGSVVKSAKSGGGPIAIASNQDFPQSVAVDGVNAYWSLRDLHTLVTAPLQGGAVTTLVTSYEPLTGLAVDGGNLYWTNGAGITFTPLK